MDGLFYGVMFLSVLTTILSNLAVVVIVVLGILCLIKYLRK